MDFSDPAEEIVNVTKDVLVGAHQEEAEVVGLAFIETMQFERILGSGRRNKPVDLAVRIAGQIDKCCQTCRLFVQTLNRHDRKHLTDGPVIQNGLKHRKVAQILVVQLLLHRQQVLGKRFAAALLNQAIDRAARRPVKPFGQRLLLQSQISQLKKQADFLPFLGSVVKDLEQETARDLRRAVLSVTEPRSRASSFTSW